MTSFLLSDLWLSRLSHFSRLLVGFSGGLDSTVLLHLLYSHPSLRKKVKVIHINHGISPNALAWQLHCEQFCHHFNMEFLSKKVELTSQSNLEEQARNARYAVFRSLIKEEDCLLLAHHGDDQAETLLLNLLRGSGIDGLGAMSELSSLGLGQMARPFLSYSRSQLEAYALDQKLTWIEDESNEVLKYSRNYLRHEIIPLLKKKWPGAIGNMMRTALHCQQALANLSDLALEDNQNLILNTPTLPISNLKKLTPDRIANLLRFWLKSNQIPLPSTKTFQRLSTEVLSAGSDARAEVSWGSFQVRLYQGHLFIHTKDQVTLPERIEWLSFPSPLISKQYNLHIDVKKVDKGLVIAPQAQLSIRFRQGGEQFQWHGQTKSLKKLFQEWSIPPWRRASVPLLYVKDELAAVVGYAISDSFYSEFSDAWEVVALIHPI